MQENHGAPVYAIDFETRYDSDYSLKNMPVWAYVYDPRFDSYMLSVAGPDDFLWVGHPKDFDWALLGGKTVVAHNLGFDGLVLKRLREEGKVPPFSPAGMFCTADLAAFLKFPRALKEIAKYVFKQPDLAAAGKQARDKMKVTEVAQLMNDPEIIRYAANDALLCRRLWLEYEHEWPAEEREASRLTRESGWRGVRVDLPYVDSCVERIEQRMFSAERSIPWDWPQGRTPLARAKMIAQAQQTIEEERFLTAVEEQACPDNRTPEADLWDDYDFTKALNKLWGSPDNRQHACKVSRIDGRHWLKKYMWYPDSFAMNDAECEAWEDQYGDRFEWLGAVRAWRRHNMIYQKFKHLQKYTSPDGRYRTQLKYCGTHTGRWSGSGFFNIQNLPKKALFCDSGPDGKDVKGTGFDLRRCFLGNFYQVDYNQIEARALIALVKDERQLPKLRAGMSVYQAHAEATTGRTWKDLKTEDFPLYQAKKMEVLLLGYGGGGKKLAHAAYMMTKDSPDPDGVIRWSEEEASAVVSKYRSDNPGIVAFWRAMQGKLDAATARGDECLMFRLPSGRIMRYWNPRRRVLRLKRIDPEGAEYHEDKVETFTQHARNVSTSYRRAYGANIVENLTQAICRDLLRDAWLALEAAGFNVAFTVHDEFVVDLSDGQTPAQVDEAILRTGNESWARFIPLAVEGKLSPHFTK